MALHVRVNRDHTWLTAHGLQWHRPLLQVVQVQARCRRYVAVPPFRFAVAVAAEMIGNFGGVGM